MEHNNIPVIVNDFACITQEWEQYKFPKVERNEYVKSGQSKVGTLECKTFTEPLKNE